MSGDAKLSAPFSAAIRDPSNQVFLSVVSFWQTSVKPGLSKLPLPQPPAQFIPLQREKHLIAGLALEEAAMAQLGGLPALHRDPFDRMLVCQAQAHGLTPASSDPLIRQYPVTAALSRSGFDSWSSRRGNEVAPTHRRYARGGLLNPMPVAGETLETAAAWSAGPSPNCTISGPTDRS